MTDLFGHAPAQASLFGNDEGRMAVPQRPRTDFPAVARARLNALLAKARAAETMPWNERDARMWQTVFPNMAKWLPDDEADQLRLEFTREIERLKAA